MSWGETLVEDIALVKGGKRLPSGHSFADSPTDHIYIRARDIGGGKIEIKEPVYLMEATRNILQRYTVEEGDVVVTIVGANVGDVGYVKEELSGANLTENAAKLVVDKSRYDPYFLKLILATESSKKRLAFIASGAAQGKLGLYKIKSFPVVAPPIDIQRKIAAIGRNYDDLIENNRRRIQLLEQAARLLYKEWFVHLRFPGHEHVSITDSVPEGWEKKPLGEVAPLKYGKALKKDDRVPGSFPVYGSSGIVGTHEKALVTGPAIIVGRKGNVGSVYWSKDDFHPIDTVYFIETEHCTTYLYYALLHTQFINTDVAVPGLNRDLAHSRTLLIPDDKIFTLFEQNVAVIHDQIDKLTKYNEALTQARDFLLPRLMNGEVVA
jgi:type I restriction enzyme S subunit